MSMKRWLERKKQVALALTGVIVAVVLILVLVSVALKQTQPPEPVVEEPEVPRVPAKYELTEVDVFALQNFTSADVSVLGVRLGDSFSDVIKILGYPDKQAVYEDGNVMNLEYGKNINLQDIGLVVHLSNQRVERVTMKEPFNKLLKGATVVNHSKAEIYALFGAPDDVQHVRVSPTSALVYRLLEYKDIGLEVSVRKNQQIGLGFVRPSA